MEIVFFEYLIRGRGRGEGVSEDGEDEDGDEEGVEDEGDGEEVDIEWGIPMYK